MNRLPAAWVWIDALDDAQRAVQPACVGGDVGQGEERFRRVHVAVGAAIGFDAAPVLGKGFEHDALLLAPEKLLVDLDRVVQQGLCAGCARDHRRTGGQGDKSVQVGSLARIAIHSVGARRTSHRARYRAARR